MANLHTDVTLEQARNLLGQASAYLTAIKTILPYACPAHQPYIAEIANLRSIISELEDVRGNN